MAAANRSTLSGVMRPALAPIWRSSATISSPIAESRSLSVASRSLRNGSSGAVTPLSTIMNSARIDWLSSVSSVRRTASRLRRSASAASDASSISPSSALSRSGWNNRFSSADTTASSTLSIGTLLPPQDRSPFLRRLEQA
ncbi:hypothetical protein [uncultured Sphingomonas sp.]|uniref:hypothetical protein n=1 Tax=uncultured Sphingomonas sp. TaxID=158754 RepID=UPI0030D95230